jgi:hypothetical protein
MLFTAVYDLSQLLNSHLSKYVVTTKFFSIYKPHMLTKIDLTNLVHLCMKRIKVFQI